MALERHMDVEVDSAGTGDYHIGELPDPRARSIGAQHGCHMNMRARQFKSADFRDFDLIVVMDHANLRTVQKWAGAEPNKVRLARSFDPNATDEVVPDPYYGGLEDFEEVATMLEAACAGIMDEIAAKRTPT